MKIQKYFSLIRINIKNALVYRANVTGRVIFYFVFIFIFFSLWGMIYSGGEIAGYSLSQMIWYLCITELITFTSGNSVFGRMNEEVKSGSIAYQLLRPWNYVFKQFSEALGEMSFCAAVFTAMAVVLGLIFAGPLQGFPAAAVPLMLLSMLLSVTMNFFLMMSLGLTAFFMEENSSFYLIYQKLLFIFGLFLPIEFLPQWAQNILRYLPLSLITWGPAKMIVDFSWHHAALVLPAQALWAAAAVLLAMFIFSRGVKKVNVQGG